MGPPKNKPSFTKKFNMNLFLQRVIKFNPFLKIIIIIIIKKKLDIKLQSFSSKSPLVDCIKNLFPSFARENHYESIDV